MKTVTFEQSLNGKQSRKTYNEEHEKRKVHVQVLNDAFQHHFKQTFQ